MKIGHKSQRDEPGSSFAYWKKNNMRRRRRRSAGNLFLLGGSITTISWDIVLLAAREPHKDKEKLQRTSDMEMEGAKATKVAHSKRNPELLKWSLYSFIIPHFVVLTTSNSTLSPFHFSIRSPNQLVVNCIVQLWLYVAGVVNLCAFLTNFLGQYERHPPVWSRNAGQSQIFFVILPDEND